jgi:hypothetical protein
LHLVFSNSKNVSAVRTPYLPPETNLSRTYSVPALTQVGHQFPCFAQPHRANSSAFSLPRPVCFLRSRPLVSIRATLLCKCSDAISVNYVQFARICLLLIVVVGAYCFHLVSTCCRASVSCIVAILIFDHCKSPSQSADHINPRYHHILKFS